jgi:hypothetical protein
MTTLEELSTVSKKLNKKTDALNLTITTFNEKLAKLNLGVEAWVGMTEGDPGQNDDNVVVHDETWLGYCRFERGWELAIKVVERDDDGNTVDVLEEATPLLNASREIRAKAMGVIPRLLAAIRDEAESLVDSIQEAEEAAENL